MSLLCLPYKGQSFPTRHYSVLPEIGPFLYLTDLGKARAALQRHRHTLLHKLMDLSDLARVMQIVLVPKAVRLPWLELLLEVS